MTQDAPATPDPETAALKVGGRPHRRTAEVVIIGGGLSGAAAAVVLGRAGIETVLVDPYPVYPPDFRVEKVCGEQLDLLRRLGLYEPLARGASRFDRVLNVRGERLIDITRGEHLSLLYQDIVRIVRGEVPPSVRFAAGRVASLRAGPDRQDVTLASGETFDARLIVLATGPGDALRQKLGISRRTVFEKHSLTFGFSIVPRAQDSFACSALTAYGEARSTGIDYLALLPLGNVTRANLFTYRDPREPWARAFRAAPKQALLDAMPGLGRFLGDFEVTGNVDVGVMDLYVVDRYRRDGVVLIGDAFQTSSPPAGTGVSRLLVDVDRLCNAHLPRWLTTPGMSVAKIEAFYDDPVKQASDARAARMATERRSFATGVTLRSELHRRQHYARRTLKEFLASRMPDRRGSSDISR